MASEQSTSGTEQTVPLSEIKEVHSQMSAEASENSEHREYSIGAAVCADELLNLIERYEDTATGRDTEVQQAHCDRCGTVGPHLICITTNRKGGFENWKPLCDNCLEEFGEWFNCSIQTASEQSGGDA